MTGELTPGAEDLFDIDRKRGVLTREDRRFLLGQVDLEQYDDPEGTAYQRRRRIRDRIRNALLDFSIIVEAMDARDVENLFEDLYDWYDETYAHTARGDMEQIEAAPPLADGWESTISFLAFAMAGRELFVEERIEAAVEKAVRRHRYLLGDEYVDADATLRIETEDVTRFALDDLAEYVRSEGGPEEEEELLKMLEALVSSNRMGTEEAVRIYGEFLED